MHRQDPWSRFLFSFICFFGFGERQFLTAKVHEGQKLQLSSDQVGCCNPAEWAACCSLRSTHSGFRHTDPNLLSQTPGQAVSTVRAATRSLSTQGAITPQPPGPRGSVGPQRTHILQRETNQGRSSWQGPWKGGSQLIGVLICEDLILSPAFGTR